MAYRKRKRKRSRRRQLGAVGVTLAAAGGAYAYGTGYRNARTMMGRKSSVKAAARYGHHVPVAKVRNHVMGRKLRKMGY